MKNIYLVVAPSGAGKTSLVNELEQTYGYKSIQSYTTRKPRYEGEKGHIFVNDKEFDKLEEIIAYTEFCGFKYCATESQIEESDLYIIDPKGINYFKEHYKGSKKIKIIYVQAVVSILFERLVKRGKRTGLSHRAAVSGALKRIENDIIEFYDYNHNEKVKSEIFLKVENNNRSKKNMKELAKIVHTQIMKTEDKSNE